MVHDGSLRIAMFLERTGTNLNGLINIAEHALNQGYRYLTQNKLKDHLALHNRRN